MKTMKKLIAGFITLCMLVTLMGGLDFTSRAASEVNVTELITMTDEGGKFSSDTTTILVKFGSYSVTLADPAASYIANENPQYGDVNPLEYLYVNDKSVAEHVEEYTSTVYGNNDYMKNKAACNPICIRISYGTPGFQIVVLNSYLAKGSYTVTVKEGFRWTNTSGETLVVNKDVKFQYRDGVLVRDMSDVVITEMDVTNVVTITDKANYFSSDTTTFLIQLGSHSVTMASPGGSYIVNTNQQYGAVNLMEYVLINGKTVSKHVEDYGKLDSPIKGAHDYMKNELKCNPIFIRVSNGSPGFQVAVLNSYLAPKSYSITLKKGFTWINTEGEKMITSKDITYAYEDGVFKEGAAKKILTFDEVEDNQVAQALGVAETEYSAPTVSLTSEGTDKGKGAKIEWSHDGSKDIYQHTFTGGAWQDDFLSQADIYPYLRLWVKNPSHNHFDVSLVLENAETKNYLDLSGAKIVMKDGQQLAAEIVDVEEIGTAAGIRISKQFEGWISIPLDTSNLRAVSGYESVLVAIAEATSATIETRRIRATAPIEDYYIVDEIALAHSILGDVKSTEDGNNYGEFDTSVKGSASIKNIIFMIGDGMGDGSLAAARLRRATLYMDSIDRLGYISTNNSSDQLTDSAAAGTALATGYKTTNGTVGLLPDGTPIMNLSEWMKQFGKKIGIVTSSYMNDATPATFASHTSNRGNYASITKDFVELDVDLLLGGGTSQFNSAVTLEDGTTMVGIEYAKTVGGYQYVTNKAEMESVTSGKLLGLFTTNYLNYAPQRPATEPDLDDLTRKALSFLENDEEGFFVMIEGGNIDHANHANQAENTITETLEFDDAIKVAMDYVDAHEDTLLVITADHETGGVKVKNGVVTYGSTNHTTEPVPYYVYGAGKEYFKGLTDNTQIPKAIMAATVGEDNVGATSILGVEDLAADESVAEIVVKEDSVTFTAGATVGAIAIEDAEAKYAVVKYKNSVAGLCGKFNNILVPYLADGEWHISDVIHLEEGADVSFAPLGCIKDGALSSIEIEGATVEIAYVAFYDTYAAAEAGRMDIEMNDVVPQIKHKCEVTKVARVEATAAKTGVKEHYKCSCGKLYADATCTKVVTASELVIAKKKVTVAKTSFKKITAKKKALTIKWKKKSGVTGYEVQVALKKNFKKIAKKATVKGAGKVSKTIKGLKSGKKYYVRVRVYKVVDGVKFTSNWVKFNKAVKAK